MSYCRWSSDDFQCDIYCYAHCDGGYRIHVATNRVDPLPLPPLDENASTEAFVEHHMKVMELMKTAEHKRIGLSCDGETYHEQTARGAAEQLKRLKGIGYNVPQYAIDSLLEDAVEEEKDAPK